MDLRPILEKLYPEKCYGGQCGIFAHKLVDFPLVGNTLASKTQAVQKFGIPAAELNLKFQPGDVVITSESRFFGHVLVINFVTYIENSDQAVSFQATESNFNLDLRVHHTRILNAASPVIVGVIRGKLLIANE